jgi:succinyl-diaminopimelate desuccinylase
MSDTAIKYAQDLIACESITPIEGGALTYLETVLSNSGFSCTRLPYSE